MASVKILIVASAVLLPLIRYCCAAHPSCMQQFPNWAPEGTIRAPPGARYAVLGGTGTQGGSAIDALISLGVPASNIRTITQNKASKAARKLIGKGVEVVEGGLDDDGALENLFTGADHVFAITFSGKKEFDTGKRLGQTLKRFEGQIKRLVFSSGSKTNVEELDIKSRIEGHFTELLTGIKCQVYLHTSFFYEMLVFKDGQPRVELSDTQHIFKSALPADLRVPMVSAADIGRTAAYALVSPGFCQSQVQQIPLVGSISSGTDFAREFSKVAGRQATYEAVDLAKLGIPQDDLDRIEKIYDWYRNEGFRGMVEGIKVTETVLGQARIQGAPLVRGLAYWMQTVGKNWVDEVTNTVESKEDL